MEARPFPCREACLCFAAWKGLLGRLSSAAEAPASSPPEHRHARSRAAQCTSDPLCDRVRLRKKKPRRVAGVQTAVAVTTGACPGRKSREQMLKRDGSAVLGWICQEVVANPTAR